MNKPEKDARPQMHGLVRIAAASMILAGCAHATTSGSMPGSSSRDDISELGRSHAMRKPHQITARHVHINQHARHVP